MPGAMATSDAAQSSMTRPVARTVPTRLSTGSTPASAATTSTPTHTNAGSASRRSTGSPDAHTSTVPPASSNTFTSRNGLRESGKKPSGSATTSRNSPASRARGRRGVTRGLSGLTCVNLRSAPLPHPMGPPYTERPSPRLPAGSSIHGGA